jgi:putative transposase
VLQARGHRVGRHRVMRLMRAEGLRARGRRRFRAPAPGDVHPPAPDRLRRCFHTPAMNRCWAADMTALPTGQGQVHLAVILDLYSRRVIGWALRPTPDAQLATAALQMALRRRRPAPGTLHHSDRGSAYASHAYRAVLAAHGLVSSMSRPRNCWDNAVVESFFSTLKQETGDRWATHADAARMIALYIEAFYNPVRLHSTLGYQAPVAYEIAASRL